MVRHSLNAITVEGFTSIRPARVPLDSVNVLVGANGAGKSNFIRRGFPAWLSWANRNWACTRTRSSCWTTEIRVASSAYSSHAAFASAWCGVAIAPRRRSDLDEAERRTAHRIYNELASRIALRELPDSEGLLRGALASLHVLFDRIRQIGGEVDPDVLRRSTAVRPGLRTLIHQLQEEILRPFLTRWHPQLDNQHDIRPPGIGSRDHELAWPMQARLRTDLGTLQTEVAEVAAELAVLSGNPLS